ncbi:MAG: O-antigen ligase family protein [Pseudomonadota bacterium]
MDFKALHRFLLNRGMVYLYSAFIAGYFLLPMAAGHRRAYYILVLPAAVLLWRELRDFYRENLLSALLLIYCLYMMTGLAWTDDFTALGALQSLGHALCVLSFCYISGYLWVEHAAQMDQLARRVTWLAGAAALVSILAWYVANPFPFSRLEPLGVMHHQNKAASAYGVFLVLTMHFLVTDKPGRMRLVYAAIATVLLALVAFTQSRTAMAGVTVGLLVLLGYRGLGIAIVGVICLWALMWLTPEFWDNRVGDYSFRPGIWESVIESMQGHWLAGHGYLVDPRVHAYEQMFDHAHNSYLGTLRDGGLIGLLLLMAILAVALSWAWTLHKQGGERIYLALLLYGMTSITMDYDRLLLGPREIWLFFWLPIALIMATYPARTLSEPARYPGFNR